ncbi:MAG: hypothetical protein ACREJ2_18950 [Planctomycetota bacterium]
MTDPNATSAPPAAAQPSTTPAVGTAAAAIAPAPAVETPGAVRSSRRSFVAAEPPSAAPSRPSRAARRWALGLLAGVLLALIAVPVVITWRLYTAGRAAERRVDALGVGSAADREQVETDLLADWPTMHAAVAAAVEDSATPAAVLWRCREMMRMRAEDEALAARAQHEHEIRLAFTYGDFLSQERAEDKFLADWPQMEQAAFEAANDPNLIDRVRLRCQEMVELKSSQPAAVAMANYSRATRCYRAAGDASHPAAGDDVPTEWIHDDANQYQTPDAGVPLGTPLEEAYTRARDGFGLAQNEYYDISDVTSGNQKASAEERAQRCARLYEACLKFMPLPFYDAWKKQHAKDGAPNPAGAAPQP